MPCYSPITAYLYKGRDGNHIFFKVHELRYPLNFYTLISLPCGRCIGCRLERSRQWAARIMCESQSHVSNSFLTLTYAVDPLSLSKRDCQLFFKRLRKLFACDLRYYLCGEYGDKSGRPHYHCCLFGLDFSADRSLFKSSPVGDLYYSEALTSTWGLGHCLIGDLTFESAAYVARYCLKKVTGKLADSHYQGRLPEFALMSRRPGIGAGWLSQYMSDCYPSDELIVRGRPSKPPRYFDDLYALTNPSGFDAIKVIRAAHVKPVSDMRLAAKQSYAACCMAAKASVKEMSV